MKMMKNVLACILAIALLGACFVCAAADEKNVEVTTVSATEVYNVPSGSKSLEEVSIGTTLTIRQKKARCYFVYRLSDDELKKLAEATSVSLDIAFGTSDASEYTAALISQKNEENVTISGKAWGMSGTSVTAVMDENKVASFDVKSVMQDESQTDNVFMFKVIDTNTNTIATSNANPVLKITTAAKTAADLDLEEISVPSEVKESFVLPTTGTHGSTITWQSNNAVISIDGASAAVTRPSYGDGNAAVKLTATAVNGEDTAAADFTVTVLKSQAVDEETISVEASLDTYVVKNYEDKMYNDSGCLYLKGSGRQNFIRFDADSSDYFANASYASINLYVTSVTDAPSINLYGLSGEDKTSWIEAMNYTGAQALGLVDPGSERYGSGEYLTTASPEELAAGQWVSIDITDFVKAQEDGIASFRLFGSASAQVATRETEHAPYIEILSGDKGASAADAANVSIPGVLAENTKLPATGANGSTITWTGDNAAITVDEQGNALVTRGDADAECTLTMTVTKGSAVVTKKFTVTVPSVLVYLTSETSESGSTVTTSLYDGYSLGNNQVFTALYDESGNLVNVHFGAGTFELASEVKTVKAMLWKLNSIMPIEIQSISVGEQVTE